jgi:hypothetical protein
MAIKIVHIAFAFIATVMQRALVAIFLAVVGLLFRWE